MADSPLTQDKEHAEVDDRCWDPSVPIRTKRPPKRVQDAYCNCQYEVRCRELRRCLGSGGIRHALASLLDILTSRGEFRCKSPCFNPINRHASQTQYLEMRDGVRIAADVLRPPVGRFDESRGLPCVLLQTRYVCDSGLQRPLPAIIFVRGVWRSTLSHAVPDWHVPESCRRQLCVPAGTSEARWRGGPSKTCSTAGLWTSSARCVNRRSGLVHYHSWHLHFQVASCTSAWILPERRSPICQAPQSVVKSSKGALSPTHFTVHPGREVVVPGSGVCGCGRRRARHGRLFWALAGAVDAGGAAGLARDCGMDLAAALEQPAGGQAGAACAQHWGQRHAVGMAAREAAALTMAALVACMMVAFGSTLGLGAVQKHPAASQ